MRPIATLSSSPARLLLLALLANLLLCLLTVWLALQAPALGVQLRPADDPAAPPWLIRPGLAGEYRLLALLPAGDNEQRQGIALRSDDLLEEPDTLDSYPEMAAFFARQQVLYDMLQGPLSLDLERDGQVHRLAVTPAARPLASLPPMFWFQVAVNLIGFLIGLWVLALRPGDWGARMFAITGLSFPLFTLPAAIYSGRELALPGEWFRLLSSLNHFGALSFGCGLVALFLCYPRRLLPLRYLLALPLLFGGWWLADALRLAADQDWGSRFPVLLQLTLAIVFAVVQWQRAKQSPTDRAAMRWLLLSTSVGCGLFVLPTAGSLALGQAPSLSQGYAFGFFLIMHGGLALGVRRYRLFDLDRWSYRILLWVFGAALVIGLDAVLVSLVSLEPGTALGLTLLACGWVYFPLRQGLWHWLLGRQESRLHDCLPELVAIAFEAQPALRLSRWQAILQHLFDPLTLTSATENDAGAAVRDNGLALLVPACAGLPALRLAYREQGRRLFSPRDARFVATLCQLMASAASSRDAYELGVSEERRRLAEDMHDDIGARLLMLIHRAENDAQADIARAAMTDLRTAIAALDSPAMALGDALADWRADLAERCEVAAVRLDWQASIAQPARLLDARCKANLERALREAASNAIRHAQPALIQVLIDDHHDLLSLSLRHDGRIADPAGWPTGHGTRNMAKRLRSIGGSYQVSLASNGWLTTTLQLPLPAAT